MSGATPAEATRSQATALLVFGWLLVLGPFAASGLIPIERDQLITHLPMLDFLGRSLRAGHLPGWYPYESIGVPFIGQILDATFHPKSLLLLAMAPASVMRLQTLGAFALALAGACRFARAASASRSGAVTAAFAFAFGGYAFSMSDNAPYQLGLAHLPWVGWAALRLATTGALRHLALLSLAWALVFLAGDAQGFFVASMASLAALLSVPLTAAAAGRFAGAGLLAALLTSASLLPALELSSRSVRALGTASASLGVHWALHPLRLFELVAAGWIPRASRVSTADALLGESSSLWSTSLFFGAVALFALLHAPLRRRAATVWGALGALLLLLALGDRLPVLPMARAVVPLFGQFRFPEKWLAGAWLCAVPLTALGTDLLLSLTRRQAATRAALAAALAAGVALVVLAFGLPGPWLHSGNPKLDLIALGAELRSAWTSGLFGAAAALGGAALLLAAAPAQGRRWALAGITLLELCLAHGGYLAGVPAALIDEAPVLAPPLLAAIRPDAPPPLVTPTHVVLKLADAAVDAADWIRVMRGGFIASMPGLLGIATLDTNLPGQTAREQLLFGTWGRDRPKYMGRLGSCFKVDMVEGGRDPLAFDPPQRRGLFAIPCLPQARLAPTVAASDFLDAAAQLRRGLPEEVVPLEGGPSLPAAEGEVRFTRWSADHLALEAEVRSPGPAALFIALHSSPGWTATVDGEPAPLLPALLVGSSVLLTPGAHTVALDYATPRLELGLTLSSLGLVVCLLLVLIDSRRRGAVAAP